MIWNEEKDIMCLEIVVEPYKFIKSTKERGDAWRAIAEELKKIEL